MSRENRRKQIPLSVKLAVSLRKLGFKESEINWDHNPPLALREWDEDAQDTIPPANDPEHIQILPIAEHKSKTTGRKGESHLNAVHGDVAEIARLRRLTAEQEAFRQRMLTKGEPKEEVDSGKKKSRWSKRPFSSGGKREPLGKRLEEGDGGSPKIRRRGGLQVRRGKEPSFRRVQSRRSVA